MIIVIMVLLILLIIAMSALVCKHPHEFCLSLSNYTNGLHNIIYKNVMPSKDAGLSRIQSKTKLNHQFTVVMYIVVMPVLSHIVSTTLQEIGLIQPRL